MLSFYEMPAEECYTFYLRLRQHFYKHLILFNVFEFQAYHSVSKIIYLVSCKVYRSFSLRQ